jgi:hypothetical protein
VNIEIKRKKVKVKEITFSEFRGNKI